MLILAIILIVASFIVGVIEAARAKNELRLIESAIHARLDEIEAAVKAKL